MSDIYVSGSDPEGFERSFVGKHPALGMQLSANSGAVWGDGDARPEIIDRSMMQFNAELKVRSGTPQHYRPVPNEWRKAREQLKKRNPGAIRLFAVYQQEDKDYAVSIPREECGDLRWILEVQGDQDYKSCTEVFECGGDILQRYNYQDWKTLYKQISEYRKREPEPESKS